MNKASGEKERVVITRKIQLELDTKDKEEWLAAYRKLCVWRDIVGKAANWIVTHHYLQDQLKDLFYLTEDVKVKLADAGKDPDGILNTSRLGTTYRLLSARYKSEIPMAIITTLNSQVVSVFDNEKREVREGLRSLRTFRKGQPIPFSVSDMIRVENLGNGEYRFRIYGLTFVTRFGRDKGENRQLFESALLGEIKLCNGQLTIEGNKIFWLAVFSYPRPEIVLSPDTKVNAWLSPDTPIIAESGDRLMEIGSREEYLYRRLAIQRQMRSVQLAIPDTGGGRGRAKKLSALKRFHHLEKNYVRTRLHQYAAQLIRFCEKCGAGVLVLREQKERERVAGEDAFLLRNWGYYGLKEKIQHKADAKGIVVLTE